MGCEIVRYMIKDSVIVSVLNLTFFTDEWEEKVWERKIEIVIRR